MKILVPTKRVPDTDQKIRVLEDGTGIEEEMLPFVINPFDAIALEEALRIREGGGDGSGEVEVVVVGIGGTEYESVLRSGLAMGADRAVHVVFEESLDPWNVARMLKAMVEREAPTFVLMGKQAVDDDMNQTGQFLAGLLGWPQATFASKVELLEGKARVARETDTGIERVVVDLPAVITTDLRLNEPRYASLPSIIKSKKKPIEAVAADELGVAVEPRVEVVSMASASTQRTTQRVASVEELIEKLRDEAGVL